MNSTFATPPPEGWEKARIGVDNFLALRESGAFAAYHKAELLDGEMWGVFRAPEDCGQSFKTAVYQRHRDDDKLV